MPKGTRVHDCYDKLKGEKGKGSAAAICQSSTGQSLKTGKELSTCTTGETKNLPKGMEKVAAAYTEQVQKAMGAKKKK